MTKPSNPWIVGGDDILHRFVVSRLARPNDEQTNCAREWIMEGRKVKEFTSHGKAEKCAKANNRFY